jgi:hypothetical protein
MWLGRYERLWAESFGRLDDHLARITAEQATAGPRTKTNATTRNRTKRGTR